MSKLSIRGVLAATIVVVGMTSVGLAQAYNNDSREERGDLPRRLPPEHAPEIDSASATTALALLAGGLLIIRGRRR